MEMIQPPRYLKKGINLPALKLTVALLTAFGFYLIYPLNTAYWSLVTIVAITQVGFEHTLSKSIMRFLGTIVGALLGFGIGFFVNKNMVLLLPAFTIGVFFTSLIAVQRTNIAYGGVVSGITLVIVLASSMLNDGLIQNALYRSLEVSVGIFILLFINVILLLLFQPKARSLAYFLKDIKNIKPDLKNFSYDKDKIIASIKIALACLLTLAIWLWIQQPEGFWATVSCLLVMEESINSTRLKASNRILAHFIAAGIGVISALTLGQTIYLLVIPLLLGGYFCGWLISLNNKYSPLGTTTGIAFIIMLLVEPGSLSTLHTTLWRFFNVMFGVIVAILLTQYLPKKALKGNG